MADQQVNFILKATNQASAEFAKVAADMDRLNHAAVNAQKGVVQFGTAWGTATAGAKGAAEGLGKLDQAAKGLASGGFQQLLSTIPGVGGALANLAQTLGGFPLLLGGLAAAGIGVLKFLQGLGKDSDAALAKVTALSEGIAAATRQTVLEVAKIRADAAGNKAGVIEAENAKELAAIEDAKNKRIAAARSELDSLDLFARRRTELSQGARNEILAAEADFELKKFALRQRANADLGKLDKERLEDEKKNREAAVAKEAEAVEKQKALVKDLTASSLATFRELGSGFEDVVNALDVATYVAKTNQAIADLTTAIGLGLDTTGRFAAGITALTQKQQEAVALGYVPTIAAATKVAEAVTVAATATDKASDSIAAGLFRMGAASAQVIATLDAVIAKGAAVQQAAAAAGGGGGSGPTTPWGASFSRATLDLANQGPGSGLTPLSSGASQYGYDLGTISHPTSRTSAFSNPNPAANAGYRAQPTVYNVNIQQSGTVIQQERDWQTLVQSLASSLQAAR